MSFDHQLKIMKKIVWGGMLFFIAVNVRAQTTCQLVVKVNEIKEVKGSLKYAVYDHSEKFLKEALAFGDASIKGNSVVFTVDGLEKGFYAVSIYQDENGNGKLDANFIGIPSEPYAFSNNARGKFGPPSFEDCRFELRESTEIIIQL